MIRLVQLENAGVRRLAIVEDQRLLLLERGASVYEMAQACVREQINPEALLAKWAGGESLDYDEVHSGASAWRLLPSADHPYEPARCIVSGTGLTHLASAQNRQAMHGKVEDLTDSMRMYRWGVEGGKPAPGENGVSPEWFYKGNGSCLRGHNDPLDIPGFAEDGGEEPEIAGEYWIDDAGFPWRIGFTQGNEFSDHEFERRNYLYLASSKLRSCSIGPELVISDEFAAVSGDVRIERGGRTLWAKPIGSGESNMSHSLANIEHHHFKFNLHRRPGDIHIHYFGASAFSFGDGIRLETGDVMQVHFDGFGRPLRNPLRRIEGARRAVASRSLLSL